MNIYRWSTGLGALALLTVLVVWNGRMPEPGDLDTPVTRDSSPPPAARAVATPEANRARPDERTSPEGEVRAAVVVNAGETLPILGQSLKLRELRSADGELRNLEFVFRRGILPRRLFPGTRQLIDSYRPLYRNSVGYGAATVLFLYQLVREDRNGDGRLTRLDGVDLAISRPDGSGFRILDRGLKTVMEVEHIPAQDRLRLAVEVDGARERREYTLSGD